MYSNEKCIVITLLMLYTIIINMKRNGCTNFFSKFII